MEPGQDVKEGGEREREGERRGGKKIDKMGGERVQSERVSKAEGRAEEGGEYQRTEKKAGELKLF